MPEATIVGIDYVLPQQKTTNQELEERHPEWQMDQVVLRTGVESRQWCREDETALDLAEAAVRRLADRLAADIDLVDTILFCTQSPDHVMPPNATLLQHRLGLKKSVAALDYTLACSGYVYGLFLAKALLRSEMTSNIVLVTSETYSKWMNPNDRGPATLFGDGAAATWITAGDTGIGEFVLGTDGGNAGCFIVPAGGARQPMPDAMSQLVEDASGGVRTPRNLAMNGAAVLDFVKREIPQTVAGLFNKTNLSMEDIDLVIFHQASRLTLDLLNRALRVPSSKQFSNIAHIGNTVSASIPIALRDAEIQGVLKPGMQVLVVGFGVGLSWGATLLRW